MDFGKAVGTACGSFAVTNIDDIFVLVTFFAEASTSNSITPLMITIGQYIGFTVIIIVSMIGFGASLLLPSEPIGFLGLLPILLGIWGLLDLLPSKEEPEDSNTAVESTAAAASFTVGVKTILKVSTVTVTNGGDNIGTYVPLFSQAKGAEIAVYVVTYYILLGVWCLAAFLVMKQKHILRAAQRYARVVVPFLYMGLGVFIIVKSECYPWSIERIDDTNPAHPGKTITAVTTTVFLLACTGAMLWFKLRKKAVQPAPEVGGSDPGSLELAPAASLGQKHARDKERETLDSSETANATHAAGTGTGETDVPCAARQAVVKVPANSTDKTEPSTCDGGQ
ncbi:hypothetical protein RB595_000344 [Gaeumannomyces hyphopodioides]